MSEGRRDGQETGPTSEQDRKLRARAHEIGRRERQLLNIIASLVVVLVGVCVAKYVEKQRTIVQLQNSVAEKERIITQLQNSVVEKQRIITGYRGFPLLRPTPAMSVVQDCRPLPTTQHMS